MYASIGYGGITVTKVINKVKDDVNRIRRAAEHTERALQPQQFHRPASRGTSGVIVAGLDNCLIKFARCCTPIPGDDIIGFVSQGQGIKVHRKDCPNVNTEEAKKRLIEVYWDYPSIESKRFEVDLEIVGADRTNLLTDIITTLGALKINILSVHGDVIDMTAKVNLKIAVDSSEQLKLAKANLMKIVGVYEIERVIH